MDLSCYALCIGVLSQVHLCEKGVSMRKEIVTYGFDGKVKHKSKEYPSKEIETRYGKNSNAVKGLGVIRHSFYD